MLKRKAVVEYHDGTTEDLKTEVTWTLVPPETGVFTVHAQGLVTAEAVGSAEISATLNSWISDRISVQVAS